MSDDHLSLDELAELDEGLLDPERTSTVRAHLHGCDHCRDRAQAVATTRSILGDLPEVPMPAHVGARLDQALAEESAERVEASRNAPDRDSPTHEAHASDVVPAPGTVARRRIGRPTLPSIAVAAALVLAVGAIVVGAVNHGSNGSSESGGSAAGVAGASQGAGGGPSIISSDQPSNFTQTSTGQSYSAGTLTSDVQGLVARAPGIGSPAGTTSQSNPTDTGTTRHGTTLGDRKHRKDTVGLNPVATPTPNTLTNQPVPRVLQPLYSSRAKILKCAADLTGVKNAVPQAVDFATWTNPQTGTTTPAAIFVFTAAKTSQFAVFVSPPNCDGSVLQFQYVPAS